MAKFLKMALMGGFAAVALSGCAATWDVDGVAAETPTGDAFTQALHAHYVESARFERDEADWNDVAFFVDRARTAAAGTAPAVQTPAERGLSAADLSAQYDRLTAALATNAPAVSPDACARAQVSYEHWLEQREEGHQADHIAAAKAAYDTAIAACLPQEAAAPAPAEPGEPKSFLVHFAFDSAKLAGKAIEVLDGVASFFKGEEMGQVEVVGHTDTAGADAYNDGLSQRRADSVKAGLVERGVPASAIGTAAKGEADPAVKRGDDVPEAANRRAEIVVRP